MKTHRFKVSLFIVALITTLISAVAPANAVQSPVGCNSNRLNLSLIKNRTSVQQGDTIIYTVTVSNVDSSPALACDIDNATVKITLPAADGTPTGTQVTLATGVSYPAGTPITTVGSASYVVNVNAGVTDIVAEARVNGVLHDAPIDHAAEIIKTVGTAVVTPTPPASGGGSPTSPSGPSSTSQAPQLPNAGAPLGR